MTRPELLAAWTAEAEGLRSWGQDPAARLLERCIAEVQAVEASSERLVDYREAASLSGYSVAQLRRLVRAGRLRDHANTGPTMLAVSELPRKPCPSRPLTLSPRGS
jgi:hypothetical protein